MSGNYNSLFRKFIEVSLLKIKDLALKNRKAVLVIVLVGFLYFFAVLIFKVSMSIPKQPPASKQHSQLYLMEFIGGYRDYQQDFDIEGLRFGEKFLSFTVNIKFQTKTVYIIKKLAIDMVLGLANEYPELESINIKVVRETGKNSRTVYGRAVYVRDGGIRWEYQ
ncbi:MAG: hypothetical protein KJ893_03360 [Candidatus Omnitrophica bacterium]|nr:hypothetical protein [Candidatus Omnitrophota bacterium]MBU4478511.1 hypothetical protein [Candidatus Omnitrophota bacterium]MCG2703692.1 hypothetical protein [Candidatus Omnitrophota bacterium]